MPLLSPLVGGPLSPCSTAVRILGALPGATLEISAVSHDPATGDSLHHIATGIASGAESIIEVPPGSLQPMTVIKAVQWFDEEHPGEHAGERSPEPAACPDGVEVSLYPNEAELGSPIWPLRLHEGGRCTALAGLFPGTLVTITDAAGAPIAEGRALDTTLRVSFSRPLRSSDRLTAKTQVCELNGPESLSPIPVISFMNSMLPPPVVHEPLIHCGTRISVGDVFEGAMVRLFRGDREIVGCFDHPELYFGFPVEDRLIEGEEVHAQQGYADLDFWSPPSDPPVVVRPLEDLPQPRPIGPICAGSFRLVVEGLVPEATVTIFNNGNPMGSATASGPTSVFSVPPLEEGNVTVEQVLCDQRSISEPIPVVSGHLDRPPTVTEPYECATIIHVKDVWPGARIRILSRRLGFIGEATAAGEEVLVRVPALSPNDSFAVYEDVCGVPTPGGEFIARSIGSDGIPAPTLRDVVLPGDRTVKVRNILPGAVVEVLINDVLRGGIESGTEEIDVPINGMMREGHSVRALQRICDRLPSWSEPFEIRRCRGRIRAGLKCLVKVDDDDNRVEVQARRLQTSANLMRRFFRFHGFDVEFVGEMEILRLPEFETVDGDNPSQLNALLEIREGLGERDIAIYQVPSVVGGGGFHRSGSNGVVTEEPVNIPDFSWVAHEVGHSLGLEHVELEPDDDPMLFCREERNYVRLMYPRSPCLEESIFADALVDDEVRLILTSPFLFSC